MPSCDFGPVTYLSLGINAFGGTAALTNVSVVGSGGVGGSEFVVVPLEATLQNPSNVSLDTDDISLPVIFQGVNIGRTALNVKKNIFCYFLLKCHADCCLRNSI